MLAEITGSLPRGTSVSGPKWDFPNRTMSNIQTLDQKVTVTEKAGVGEFHFEITGHEHVPFLVEMAFRAAS